METTAQEVTTSYNLKNFQKVRDEIIKILKHNKMFIGKEYGLTPATENPNFEIKILKNSHNGQTMSIINLKSIFKKELGDSITISSSADNKRLILQVGTDFIEKVINNKTGFYANEEKTLNPEASILLENFLELIEKELYIFAGESFNYCITDKNVLIVRCFDYKIYLKILNTLKAQKHWLEKIVSKNPPKATIAIQLDSISETSTSEKLEQSTLKDDSDMSINDQVITEHKDVENNLLEQTSDKDLSPDEDNQKIMFIGTSSLLMDEKEALRNGLKPIETVVKPQLLKRKYTRHKNQTNSYDDEHNSDRLARKEFWVILGKLSDAGFPRKTLGRYPKHGIISINREISFISKGILKVKLLEKDLAKLDSIDNILRSFYGNKKNDVKIKRSNKTFSILVTLPKGYFEKGSEKVKENIPLLKTDEKITGSLSVSTIENAEKFSLLSENIEKSKKEQDLLIKNFFEFCACSFTDALLKSFEDKQIKIFIVGTENGFNLSEITNKEEVRKLVSDGILNCL